MTIAEALKKYSDLEIDLLLGHVLKQSKEFLYLHSGQKMTPLQTKQLSQLAKKRQSGMPIAYLVGYKYFYGLKLKVNKDVLIPRPETEWLVDEVLRIIKTRKTNAQKKPLRILDVGAGSGAIAVSIAVNSNQKKAQIFATDISSKALALAKQNAKAHKVKINFSKHNLLIGVKGKFDVIIANLPYVPISDYQKLKANLKYEPRLALTDGTDQFVLIKKIIEQIPTHLNKNGMALLEVDPKTTKLFSAKSQYHRAFTIKIIKDIRGLKRFIHFSLR